MVMNILVSIKPIPFLFAFQLEAVLFRELDGVKIARIIISNKEFECVKADYDVLASKQ